MLITPSAGKALTPRRRLGNSAPLARLQLFENGLHSRTQKKDLRATVQADLEKLQERQQGAVPQSFAARRRHEAATRFYRTRYPGLALGTCN